MQSSIVDLQRTTAVLSLQQPQAPVQCTEIQPSQIMYFAHPLSLSFPFFLDAYHNSSRKQLYQ